MLSSKLIMLKSFQSALATLSLYVLTGFPFIILVRVLCLVFALGKTKLTFLGLYPHAK